jgi:twinkle protein
MGLELVRPETLARIDAERLRRVGQMLVTEAPADIAIEAETVLVDLEKLDGTQLLAEWHERQRRFATTPFDPTGAMLAMYPGGVTIWSGFPGAGKTTVLRQFICHTLHRGSSVFMASLEEDPRTALVNLAATAAGRTEPTAHQMQWFIDAFAKRFRLWGVVGTTSHLKLLAVIRHLATQGIRHAVIDSLMCLDIANDDFEGQRRFANLLAATARIAGVHIHLVAHPRKLVSADQELDLNDVAGARELGGIADNVLFVRRRTDRAEYGAKATATPMSIAVRKQRHGTGALGEICGWYQRELRQFHVEQFPQGPMHYLPDDAFVDYRAPARGQP